MDKNLHDIDKIFQEPIEGYTEMPSDKVWQGIDQHLDKKNIVSIKKKYQTLKRIAAILLLLLCTGIGYEVYVKTTAEKEIAGNENKTEIKKDKASSNSGSIIFTDKNAAKEITEDAKNNTTEKATGKKITDSVINYVDDKKQTSNNKISNFNKSENAVIKNQPVNKKNFSIDVTSSNTVATKNNKKDKEIITQLKNKNYTASEKQAITKQTIKNKTQQIDLTTKNDETTAKNKQILNPALTDVKREKMFISMNKSVTAKNLLLQNDSAILNNGLVQLRNEFAKQNAAAIKASSVAKKLHVSITPYIAPLFSFNRIENEHHHFGPGGNPRDNIKEDENHVAIFSAGSKVEIPLTNKLILQTGFSYMQSNTNIAPKKLFADHDNNGQIRYRYECSSGYTYINPKAGAPVAVGDSITTQGGINELKYISVPVAVGYTFKFGRFNIIPSAGGAVNFLAGQKLETELDQNITTVEGGKKTFTNIEGLKKTYFNALADVAIEYKLSNKLSLSITPSTNFALSAINQNASVRSYQNTFGIKTGLKFKL